MILQEEPALVKERLAFLGEHLPGMREAGRLGFGLEGVGFRIPEYGERNLIIKESGVHIIY